MLQNIDRLETSRGIAERLAGIELRDSQSNPYTIGEFWKQRPIVLVFIRHFG